MHVQAGNQTYDLTISSVDVEVLGEEKRLSAQSVSAKVDDQTIVRQAQSLEERRKASAAKQIADAAEESAATLIQAAFLARHK